jgi:hypothetical protein
MGVRSQPFQLRFSFEERTRLMELAEHYGVSAADVLRMLLRERFEEVFRGKQREGKKG